MCTLLICKVEVKKGFVFITNITMIIFIMIFRNIVIEDPRPTNQQFFILMEGLEPYFDPEERRDPGDLNGILFQVIVIMTMMVMMLKMMVVKMMMMMI